MRARFFSLAAILAGINAAPVDDKIATLEKTLKALEVAKAQAEPPSSEPAAVVLPPACGDPEPAPKGRLTTGPQIFECLRAIPIEPARAACAAEQIYALGAFYGFTDLARNSSENVSSKDFFPVFNRKDGVHTQKVTRFKAIFK